MGSVQRAGRVASDRKTNRYSGRETQTQTDRTPRLGKAISVVQYAISQPPKKGRHPNEGWDEYLAKVVDLNRVNAKEKTVQNLRLLDASNGLGALKLTLIRETEMDAMLRDRYPNKFRTPRSERKLYEWAADSLRNFLQDANLSAAAHNDEHLRVTKAPDLRSVAQVIDDSGFTFETDPEDPSLPDYYYRDERTAAGIETAVMTLQQRRAKQRETHEQQAAIDRLARRHSFGEAAYAMRDSLQAEIDDSGLVYGLDVSKDPMPLDQRHELLIFAGQKKELDLNTRLPECRNWRAFVPAWLYAGHQALDSISILDANDRPPTLSFLPPKVVVSEFVLD